LLRNSTYAILLKDGPQQVDYISLIHTFTGAKPTNFSLRNYHKDYRLIHYGGDTYGLYHIKGYESYNSNAGTLNSDYDGDVNSLGTPTFLVKFNAKEYETCNNNAKQFRTWKAHRNHVRAALEDLYHIDTKHALHLVRLLRMGAEALETGKILVKRPDAEELISIRNGSWSYAQLIEYAEHMDDLIRNKLYHTTSLPKYVDVHFAAKLLMEVQDLTWNT
jgi:hypothetical protein